MRSRDERPATVLVIEDDRWLRSLLSDLLPAEGYVVEEASNGAAGVRLAKEHRPDVVLLDLAMPEMSGAEVLRELKSDRSTADIPIIVVSAHAGHLQSSETRCRRCHSEAVRPRRPPGTPRSGHIVCRMMAGFHHAGEHQECSPGTPIMRG
jgi:CheY-like chemotaxis protein